MIYEGIREENENDRKAIFKIISQAFGRQDEAKVVELLRDSDEYIPALSLVAVLDYTITCHILFSKIKIIADNGNEFYSLDVYKRQIVYHPKALSLSEFTR